MLVGFIALSFFGLRFFTYWIKNKDSSNLILEEINQLSLKENSLKSLSALAPKIDANLRIVDTVITPQVDIPGFMTQIETVATDAGLKVDRLTFVRTDTSASEKVVAVPFVSLSGSFTGNYDSVLKFFKTVEGARRITYSHDIKVSAVVDKESVGVYSLNVALDGFYLLENTKLNQGSSGVDFRTKENAQLIDQISNLREYQIQRLPNSEMIPLQDTTTTFETPP